MPSRAMFLALSESDMNANTCFVAEISINAVMDVALGTKEIKDCCLYI